MERNNSVNIPASLLLVKGKIASPNWLHYQAKVEDLQLKYRILRGKSKNGTSGKSLHFPGKISLSAQI